MESIHCKSRFLLYSMNVQQIRNSCINQSNHCINRSLHRFENNIAYNRNLMVACNNFFYFLCRSWSSYIALTSLHCWLFTGFNGWLPWLCLAINSIDHYHRSTKPLKIEWVLIPCILLFWLTTNLVHNVLPPLKCKGVPLMWLPPLQGARDYLSHFIYVLPHLKVQGSVQFVLDWIWLL